MRLAATEHFDIARKIVANMTSESWRNTPHVCLTAQVEMDGLLSALARANSARQSKISLNTVLMRIVAESLKTAPRMNAHLSFDRRLVRGRLDVFDNIDISMATLLPDGRMMTLNVPDTGSKSSAELQEAIDSLMRRAAASNLDEVMFSVSMADTLDGLKKGKLAQAVFRLVGAKTGKHRIRTLSGKARREYYAVPESERLGVGDLRQGTVTVSNLGAACKDWIGECTILEIVPPQVAAIGLGALSMRPIADPDGTVRAAKILPVTVAFDHRALDTADVAPFVKSFRELCESGELFI